MDEHQRKLAEELLFSEAKKPSFAKRLFFGECESSAIVPFPSLSSREHEETAVFIGQLKDFAEKNIDAAAIDRNAEIPESVIKGLGQLGVLGMTIPKKYGGLEMSQHAYCKAAETLAGYCGATSLFVNAHQSIGLKALLLFGTEEQKLHWLPPLAKGEQLAAFALTEPNAGSDASGVETTAVYNPEKDCYVINGAKQWITNGSLAKVLTVMAQTEIDTPKGKEKKITAFLVTPDMPGFEVTAQSLEKVGMRGSKTANLAFNQLEVPAKNILGPLGGGLKVCLTVLDYGRTTFGATCTGAAKYLQQKAVDYANQRYQFKRPLAAFGLVKEKIARIASLVYAMDAATYLTAGLVDNEIEDFMLEAAILKVFASESLWTIIYETMQIHGGKSFFTDYPFERMMRDGRLNMIGEGANEVLRVFIGLVGMRDVGLFYKEIQDELKKSFFNTENLRKLGDQGLRMLRTPHFSRNGLLKNETEQLENAIRRFGRSVTHALYRYQENIVEKQLVLNKIATSAIAIYTVAAVLSKFDAEYQQAGNRLAVLGESPTIAKFYCRQALHTLDNALGSLFDPLDEEAEHLADQITKVKQ